MDLCTSSFEKDVLQSSHKILAFTKIAGRGLLPTLITFSKHIFILPPFPLADYLFASYKLKNDHCFVFGFFGILLQQRQCDKHRAAILLQHYVDSSGFGNPGYDNIPSIQFYYITKSQYLRLALKIFRC